MPMANETENRDGAVLGVDPGLARAGWGVIRGGPSLSLIGYGSIETASRESHSKRLLTIFEALQEVIRRHRPRVMAVEEVFQGKNARSAMLLGEGRGACILAAAERRIPVVEYPASVVKMAVTGNGRAAKTQVQSMVHRILSLDALPRPYDASDALAVALTHFSRGRSHDVRNLDLPGDPRRAARGCARR